VLRLAGCLAVPLRERAWDDPALVGLLRVRACQRSAGV